MTGLGEQHHLHHWDPLFEVLALLGAPASTPNPASADVPALYLRGRRGWQVGISHPSNHNHQSFCPSHPRGKVFFLPSFTQGWRQARPRSKWKPMQWSQSPPPPMAHCFSSQPDRQPPGDWNLPGRTHLIPDGMGERPCLCCPLSISGAASLGKSLPLPCPAPRYHASDPCWDEGVWLACLSLTTQSALHLVCGWTCSWSGWGHTVVLPGPHQAALSPSQTGETACLPRIHAPHTCSTYKIENQK